MAGFVMLQQLSGFSWDEAFASASVRSPSEAAHGRSAPEAALALLLLGLALVRLDVPARSWWRARHIEAALAALLAASALAAHTFALPELTAGSRFSLGMAVPSAIGVLLISAGVVCARPQGWMVRLARDAGAGPELRARVLLLLAASPVVVTILGVMSQQVQITPALAITLATGLNAGLVAAVLLHAADRVDRSETERAKTLELVTQQSLHDPLTDLGNRQLFTDRLAARARPPRPTRGSR